PNAHTDVYTLSLHDALPFLRQGQERLLPYFEWKARLLGLEGLGWFDVGAPVGSAGRRPIAYDDAARFIVDRFRDVSPRLAALAGDRKSTRLNSSHVKISYAV